MDHPFGLGWQPQFAILARERMARQGITYAQAIFQDDRPLPKAFSLSRFRLWPFDQGQVGTCWCNATTQAFQIHTAADGTFEAVALSRCMTGWRGKQLDGGGNPANGGSVTHGLQAMGDAPDGVGCCHEALWPYKPSASYLGQQPPSGAVADAGLNRVHQVAEVDIGDAWKRAIFNGHPVSIGIWWPFGWDTAVDKTGRCTGIGRGTYGHALAVTGWIDDWDGHPWWEIENSHGPIYHPLPADVAARVDGYKPSGPDSTHDFWTRDDWLREVIGYGNAEMVTAAGLTGFKQRILTFQGSDAL